MRWPLDAEPLDTSGVVDVSSKTWIGRSARGSGAVPAARRPSL